MSKQQNSRFFTDIVELILRLDKKIQQPQQKQIQIEIKNLVYQNQYEPMVFVPMVCRPVLVEIGIVPLNIESAFE